MENRIPLGGSSLHFQTALPMYERSFFKFWNLPLWCVSSSILALTSKARENRWLNASRLRWNFKYVKACCLHPATKPCFRPLWGTTPMLLLERFKRLLKNAQKPLLREKLLIRGGKKVSSLEGGEEKEQRVLGKLMGHVRFSMGNTRASVCPG